LGFDYRLAMGVPDYWIKLTTPVPAERGLPHFSDVHIWNIKATGARRAFGVSAYPNAPLINFKFDNLDIQAATAGLIADAKDWAFSDINANDHGWQCSKSHQLHERHRTASGRGSSASDRTAGN